MMHIVWDTTFNRPYGGEGEMAEFDMDATEFFSLVSGPHRYDADLNTLVRDTTMEMEAGKRKRAEFLYEYDITVAQISRAIRTATAAGEDTTALEAKLAEWDTYADALCDITQAEGWPLTHTWPTKPE